MAHVFFVGWRKISCYFNISYEIRDKNIEFDQDRNVQRAEFVIRAYMQYASCFALSINLMISILTAVTATGIDFFVTSGVAGSQMVGALVTDVKRDFRNQTMISQAQRKLEPKIKLVK